MSETDHIQTIRTGLERLGDESNWRDASLQGDDETSYDAMAWSPRDISVNESGQVCDPNFHAPWKLAQAALASLSALQEERERMLRDSAILAWLWEHGTATDAVLIRQAEEAIDAAMKPAPQEGRS